MSDVDYYVKTDSILQIDLIVNRESGWCLRASARSALDGTPTGRMDSYGPSKCALVCEIAHTRCGTGRIFDFELHDLALRLTNPGLWD